MNTVRLSTIRRVLVAIAFSVAALGGLTARAEPLPMPAAAGEVRVYATPQPHYPLEGTMLTHTGVISWTDVDAKTYVLQLEMGGTNETIKHKIQPAACNQYGYCVWYPTSDDNAFFKQAVDGQTVTWKVVAKFEQDGQKGKTVSPSRLFIVDEVGTPLVKSPGNGVMLIAGQTLQWEANHAVNKKYVLRLLNTTTGEVAKHKFAPEAACVGKMCVVAPYSLPGGLSAGTTYQWSVIAKGYTGESVESVRQTFHTP
jgi:hypothetical protein